MEEENSKKMDVSYGVDNDSESAETIKNMKKGNKKSKKAKVKTQVEAKTEEAPKKKPSLISEINEMKANKQVDSPEFREKMVKLESVLGVNQINPFGTNELDIFEDTLKGSNLADLKNLAAKVGINPFQGTVQLKAALMKEFKANNKNNMRNIMPSPSQSVVLDPNNPQHAKTIEILGDI